MIDFANISLALALGVAAYATVAALMGAKRRTGELVDSARNGAIAVFGLLTIACGILLYAFATHDFRLSYVANYSSREMSPLYLLTSFYAGNEGSLLFWAWLLSLFTLIAVLRNHRRAPEAASYAMGILMAVQAFFVILVFFVANPYQVLGSSPANGRGLNPLLENPGMIIHPPTLLAGYASFAVPFAMSVGALMAGWQDSHWLRGIRVWALVSWLLLGVGNLLGAQWAYVELGWGGYWAWDPVENAGLMPWLAALAFLHSAVSERNRGMFRIWNIVLLIITFNLTIFGTFIARSGILSSLHTYEESVLTPFFLGFLAVSLIGPILLLVKRRGTLRDSEPLSSWLTRDGAFLASSVLLTVLAFSVLLGTIFPVFYQAITGRQINVTAAFFNQVDIPLFVIMLVILGICPFLLRRADTGRLLRSLIVPGAPGVVAIIAMAALGAGAWYVWISVGVCVFALTAMAMQWSRSVRTRRSARRENVARSFFGTIWGNRPRYGGFIVHFSIILIAIGVVGSSAFKVEKEANLGLGQSLNIGSYKLSYEGITQRREGKQDIYTAKVFVESNGNLVDMLSPTKSFHDSYEQPVTDVAIRSNLAEDLYVILAGWDQQGATATLKVYVNPLMNWMWIGGGVLLLGSLLALWPGKRGRSEAASSSEREE